MIISKQLLCRGGFVTRCDSSNGALPMKDIACDVDEILCLIQPDGEMMNSYSILVAFPVVFLQSQSVCTSCSHFYLSTDFIGFHCWLITVTDYG